MALECACNQAHAAETTEPASTAMCARYQVDWEICDALPSTPMSKRALHKPERALGVFDSISALSSLSSPHHSINLLINNRLLLLSSQSPCHPTGASKCTPCPRTFVLRPKLLRCQSSRPPAGNIVVKNHYVGINATDINVTNGFYGNTTPPFGCGLEAAGIVTEVGASVDSLKVGDAVVYQKFGAFSEYAEVEASVVTKIPVLTPVVLPLTVCGISASIALEQVGQMKQGGETVFVTAAAGGTGQFVVQLAKLAGNHVIGTCSSDEKVEYLKSLGCDRVINYTKEDVNAVLKAEYPQGVDLVFETVGGDMFKAAVDNIALHGRIIVFGYISNYKEATSELLVSQVNPKLLMKSASIRGFILGNHVPHVASHIARLLSLIQEGKLKAGVDPTEFKGLEGIPEAIDHMYAKKNIGKLVVKLA